MKLRYYKSNLSVVCILFQAIVGNLLKLQPLNAQEADLSEPTLTITAPTIDTAQADKSSAPGDRDLVTAQDANEIPTEIIVKDFDVVGSSVFSPQELDRAISTYRDRPLTLPELFQARSTITKLYTDKGYFSSGAYIPPQELDDGTVEIAVVEGKLSEINVSGTEQFQLSRGADSDGKTKISAVRFFQEFVERNDKQVLAFRSQFNLGVDAFNPTINSGDEPDSTFLSWRGQSQWVRRLDEGFLLLLRGDAQLATGSLVPLEQFRVGGANSARGYRQDLSLGDNGLFASAELRTPVLRFNRIDGLVQIAPFFDLGTVWNHDDVEIGNATLPSLGVGVSFSLGDRFNARLDWGIPLSEVEAETSSLQKDGIYFSLNSRFF